MSNSKIEYPQIIDEIMELLDFLPEEQRLATIGLFKMFLVFGMF